VGCKSCTGTIEWSVIETLRRWDRVRPYMIIPGLVLLVLGVRPHD
jgi:hypothetical protein